MPDKLVFSGITHFFGQENEPIKVIDKVSFAIPAGEKTCIIGPNACGKSTLLRMACGLLIPTKGKILHDEREVKSPHWSRAIIFQDLNLFPWKTASGNIAFGLKAKGLSGHEQRKMAKEYLQKLKIEKFANYYPHELSGGTKQKIAIARALALEPDVLLMDEPFSSIDGQSRELLQNELSAIIKQRKQTTLLVSHSIDEALVLADRIIVLSKSPARIKAAIKILEKHKTNPEFRYSQEFSDYKKKIWNILEAENK